MNAYFLNDNQASGRLKISINNVPELNELLKKAEKEAQQLNKTIAELGKFELNIEFVSGKSSI